MTPPTYAELLATRAWFDWLTRLNAYIQAQNERIIEIANGQQETNEKLLALNDKLIVQVGQLRQSLAQIEWLDDQPWEEFPIQ